MSDQMKTCPICSNHCAEDALSCERGRSFFQGDHRNIQHQDCFQESGEGHERGHRTHHRRSHRDFECKVEKESLSGILAQCGHYLFHSLHDGKNNEDEIFGALSDLEKRELKELLTKLLAAWNEKH